MDTVEVRSFTGRLFHVAGPDTAKSRRSIVVLLMICSEPSEILLDLNWWFKFILSIRLGLIWSRVSRRWKCSVLQSMRNYQSLSTWMTSSTHVRGPCMLSASCVRTTCAHHFSRCFSQSSSSSSPTLLRHLGGFSTSADRQRIESYFRRAARSGQVRVCEDCRGTSWRCR